MVKISIVDREGPVARIARVAAVLGIVLLGGCGAGLPDPKCHEIGYRLLLGVATLGMSELIVECVDTPPWLGWLEDLKAQSEQGDPDAQYRQALVTLDPDERWKWTCLTATKVIQSPSAKSHSGIVMLRIATGQL